MLAVKYLAIGLISFHLVELNMRFIQFLRNVDRLGLWLISASVIVFAITWAVRIVFLPSHVPLLTFEPDSIGYVHYLMYSPYSPGLASAGGHWGTNKGEVAFWNTTSGRMTKLFEDHDIHSIAFSSNGNFMAGGAEIWTSGKQTKNGTITIWETQSQKKVRTWVTRGHPITSIAFTKDSKNLLTSGRDGTVRYWSIKTGKLLRTVITNSHSNYLSILSWNGKIVSTTDGSDVLVWNTQNGKLLYKLSGHQEKVISLAFSPRNQMLATGSYDQRVCIWSTSTGLRLQSLSVRHGSPVTAVAFSPDSKTVASGHLGLVVRIWDVQTGRLLTTLGKSRPSGHIRSLAFSSDMNTLASSEGSQIKVWDISALR